MANPTTTDRPRRRRPHPAAATRAFLAGVAGAGTLAMVGAMASPPLPDAELIGSPEPAEEAAPTRVVVIRRHHAAALAPGADAVAAPVAAAPVPAAPVAVAPAPRTTTGGS